MLPQTTGQRGTTASPLRFSRSTRPPDADSADPANDTPVLVINEVSNQSADGWGVAGEAQRVERRPNPSDLDYGKDLTPASS